MRKQGLRQEPARINVSAVSNSRAAKSGTNKLLELRHVCIIASLTGVTCEEKPLLQVIAVIVGQEPERHKSSKGNVLALVNDTHSPRPNFCRTR